jgi:hypothetical protein
MTQRSGERRFKNDRRTFRMRDTRDPRMAMGSIGVWFPVIIRDPSGKVTILMHWQLVKLDGRLISDVIRLYLIY